ncbi:kinase-like protein [Pholiota conissans]|uniref:Kinase-like protein n=1 Tax=Pholiota conissans TaxID=109636 RepID=A0A9P5YSI7_9AGAR|nr:kinase-like protein [Pholiota conissans]
MSRALLVLNTNVFKRSKPNFAHIRCSSTITGVSPRIFPTTGFTTIPASKKFEEERWAWYKPQSFYPVRIGDVLHSKYQVLYKLGYGTTATSWLCRDLHRDAYVCMKSMVCNHPSAKREVKAYKAIKKAEKTTKLYGVKRRDFIRRALDHFQLRISNRKYQFLIHEPLGMSLSDICKIEGGRVPIDFVKEVTFKLPLGLETIHEAEVIHADIKESNILFHMQDETMFKEAEEREFEHPSKRKITDETFGSKRGLVLCDFGEARTGKDEYVEHVQPAPYRAPEVFLYLPWTKAIDIGTWLHEHLFPPQGEDELTRDTNQLARMVALLGPPPEALLADSGPRALEFFNEDGSPKGDVPNDTLESLLASSLDSEHEDDDRKMTTEESEMFLAFIRRALTWDDVKRPSASELFADPWVLDSIVGKSSPSQS